jgi:hypothetical protein
VKANSVLVLVLAVAAPLPRVQAIVDDAHAMAMEMATPYVEKGFKVRQDYWKGEVKSPEPKRVNSQLFKGNEYWFWLGCDTPGAELTLKVVDQQGREMETETIKGNSAVGVRLLPPRTGTYVFVFTIKILGGQAGGWALAYGYR